MTSISVDTLKSLIESNSESIEFGSEEDAVDSKWLEKAEKELAVEFTDSYRWFLKNYAGGEIGGDEIYSIYGMDFDAVNGGDIVYQNKMSRKNGLTGNDRLIFMETDLGEVFFFDYSQLEGNECPVKIKYPSGKTEVYAGNFYEFLFNRINEYVSG